MKFKVELEIDDDKKLVVVRDSRDEHANKEFKGGVHLVAADGENRIYYILAYGSSSDIGWGLAQSINDGWKLPFVKKMFFHFTEWINKFFVNMGDGYDLSDDDDLRALERAFGAPREEKKDPTIN